MEHTRRGLVAAGLERFSREAHWFDCTALFDVPKEVRDFGRDMAARGYFDLPYQKTIFWWGRAAGGPEVALLLDQVSLANGQMVRARVIAEADDEQSMLLPTIYVEKETGNIGIDGTVHATPGYELAYSYAKQVLIFGTEMLGALLSRDTEIVRVGPSEKRISKAIAAGRDPGVVLHTLILKPWLRQEVEAAKQGTRASPRLHWRRGHYRDLSGGAKERLIPIPPCIVGSKEAGMVVKDYSLS
jgi:hypothetical protein